MRRECAGDSGLHERVARLLHDAMAYDPLFDDGILGGELVRELAASEPRELGPGSVLGRYEIVDRIGSGGMGVVFRARDPQLDRPVALKVLSASLHANAERFTREARAASALNHPHIATVYELGEDDGRAFIAMELVDGPSLHARARQGPIPLEEVIRIGAQVADALAAAHVRGIVHRDLKPGNVVLCPERGVKLVDFGLAKRATGGGAADRSGGPLTSAGMVLGTVTYMSPEQAGGLAIDFRSDHFSLGTMLYELVTGHHPFRGVSHVETLAAILRDTPQALRELAPRAPHWLERVIHRCLAKDPQARFATTAELARALAQRGVVAGSVPASGSPRECRGCERTIGAEHRFCPYCGFPQGAVCGACGQRLEAGAAFCSGCGAEVDVRVEEATTASRGPKSEASRASRSLSGERRLASVVASRLDGYSTLADELDPERRRELLRGFEAEARAIADEESGLLLRFEGGELLMVFGLAGAREDDAQRAIRAAERLHRALGRSRQCGRARTASAASRAELRLCTGIYSGMVISEPADRGELQVTGPAVQAAEHLARRATAGELRVSSETRRLSEGSGFRSIGLTGARRSGESSGLSAFAGRRRELATLLEAASALGRGEGRFVEVIGEAGSGKTRLLHELRREGDWSGCKLVEARCQSYGAASPYLPLVEVLRRLMDLDDEASQEQQMEAVKEAVADFGADLEPYVPLYVHLLSPSENDDGLPRYLDRKHLRHTLQAALVGLVTLAASRRPTMILLEDWHWVDEASHEVVRQLAELTSSHALTVVVTRRPDAPLSWPPLASPSTISLSPIDLECAEQIVRSVLGNAALDREIAVALHQRSGGNPFFLEELCRSLKEERRLEESGGRMRLRGAIESLELPATVHALLRARLDRVTGVARDVLRRAAVIGREFGADVLAATLGEVDLDAALGVLRARGLIRQLRIFPYPEYTFQHILVQEAAYESLLRHQRVSLHGQVGRAIERVHAGRLEEHLERLAHHFAQAESWSKAVHYGRRAARRAGDLSHFAEAMSMIDRSLEWLEWCPEGDESRSERIGLLLDKERLCETLGWRDEQVRLIEELLAILVPRGDSAELVDVLIRKGELEAQLAKYQSGATVLLEARDTSRRLGDLLRERNSLRGLSFLRWHEQRLEEVVELLREALELDRRLGDQRAEVQELANIGTTLRRLNRPREALTVLHEAQELNQEVKDALRETNILYMLSWVYRSLGDDERARECLIPEEGPGDESAIERPYQMIALASLALEHGQVDESLEFLRQSIESCRASRYRAGLAHSLRSLAETLIRLGRSQEALEAGLEGAELFAQLGESSNELRLRAMCAPLLDSQGRSEALQSWQRVMELSATIGRPDLEIEGLLGCARNLPARDELDAARELLLRALSLCELDPGAQAANAGEQPSVSARAEGERVGGERPWQEARSPGSRDAGALRGEVLNNLGIVEWRLGSYENALDRYRQALEHFQSRGDHAHEGLMLNSIGATLRQLGRPEEAAAILLRAESVHRESGEELLRGHASALLGDIERDAGRLEEAHRWYEQSLDIRRAIGDLGGEAWMHLRLAEVAAGLGSRERAAASLSSAAALGLRLEDERIGAECSRLERAVGESDA
ncbi:MAG TPA: tetratricopeptide repeat protein [Thermoanaerobaculia bacterium]|nr:tetratricopeptide repeat protein [Thermoanaerobaculia bacterium]